MCRAFGCDNRVLRINNCIKPRHWPEPYLLAKLIRRIACPVVKYSLVTKKFLSDLSGNVWAHIYVSSHTGHTEGDVEMRQCAKQEETEAPEQIPLENSPAKDEFRNALRTVFSDAECLVKIMQCVDGLEYF